MDFTVILLLFLQDLHVVQQLIGIVEADTHHGQDEAVCEQFLPWFEHINSRVQIIGGLELLDP